VDLDVVLEERLVPLHLENVELHASLPPCGPSLAAGAARLFRASVQAGKERVKVNLDNKSNLDFMFILSRRPVS
ncbi:MAG: hypothetical protein LCH80_20420, partial [Proteobacteria bacterium]|nr:hypothetical protein [Pseudomonadota bacterium]